MVLKSCMRRQWHNLNPLHNASVEISKSHAEVRNWRHRKLACTKIFCICSFGRACNLCRWQQAATPVTCPLSLTGLVMDVQHEPSQAHQKHFGCSADQSWSLKGKAGVQGYELDHNDWLPRQALQHNVALDAWEKASSSELRLHGQQG